MKKVFLVLVVALLIGGGVWLYKRGPKGSGGVTDSYKTVTQKQEVLGENTITVSDQAAVKTVLVSSAKLAENGYVVIHEDSAGKPGPVIGNSSLLAAGPYNNLVVNLNRTTKDGETLYAMLHKDSGDGAYKFPGDDLPVFDTEGKAVLVKFKISAKIVSSGEAMVAPREITVSGSEFSFSPSTLEVKAGEKVRLTFKNTGKWPHDWVIEELGIRTKKVASGQTDTIEFTAPTKPGTLEYKVICSVPGHAEAGMTGKLVVK